MTKMSDVFDLPLAAKEDKLTDQKGLLIAYSCDAEHIATCVNSHDQLVEALNDLLNDCINFDGGKLSDCYMEQASKLLKTIKGESDE